MKIKVNINGFGINYFVLKPETWFTAALQNFAKKNNILPSVAIFDLSFFEFLNQPGICNYADLAFIKSFSGLYLSKPGSIEIRNGRQIISKLKVHEILSPKIFDTYLYTSQNIDLNTFADCIVIKEETVGLISSFYLEVAELKELTNLIYPMVTIQKDETFQQILCNPYLINNWHSQPKSDCLIRSLEAHFIK